GAAVAAVAAVAVGAAASTRRAVSTSWSVSRASIRAKLSRPCASGQERIAAMRCRSLIVGTIVPSIRGTTRGRISVAAAGSAGGCAGDVFVVALGDVLLVVCALEFSLTVMT